MKSVKIAKFLVAVVLLLLLMGTVRIWFGWSSGRFAKKVRHIILISIDTCRAEELMSLLKLFAEGIRVCSLFALLISY